MHTRLELYQRVTPLAGLGIFERNLITGEIYWNEIIREILEVGPDYHPTLDESLRFYKDPQQIKQLIQAAVISGRPEVATVQLIATSNTLKWVQIRVQADVSDGAPVTIYGTLEDVTAEVTMNALLEERQKLFAQAFDHAPIGMALVSLTGGWIKVNGSLCRMLGYAEEEFLKQTFQDFTHPEDLDSDLKLLNELVSGAIQTYKMEKRYFHREGHVIWVALNVSLIRTDTGEPLYFVSQIKDITERVNATAIIRDQNSRLLNFAHIVSHNLRSHTGNMKMLTDMILAEPDGDERNKMLNLLNENSANLLKTLEDLHQVVEVQHGNNVEKVKLNLANAVLRVQEILAASMREAGAQVIMDVADDLYVSYYPAYLESIFINLISNSLKYRHTNRAPVIRMTATRVENGIEIQFEDNGQGMDLALHGHKLFGLYKTFHNHPDARGMGLFLVKNQIESMGGTIAVESRPGEGTTFKIFFS